MAFYHKYPYTDFHELNLDWFLSEFKKVTDGYTTLEQTVQQFTDFVTNYFDNLDVQAEVNTKLNQMAADGTLQALLQPAFDAMVSDVNTTLNTQNADIAVLEARMDTFASLPPGSTAGNAEILDSRVGNNGIVYPSSGDAIREQIGDTQHLMSCEVNYGKNAYNEGFNTSFYVANDKIDTANVTSSSTRISNIRVVSGAFDATQAITMHEKLRFTAATGYSVAYGRYRWQDPSYMADTSLPFAYHTGVTDVEYNPQYPICFFMVKKNDDAAIDPSDLDQMLTIEVINDLKSNVESLMAAVSTGVVLPFSMDGMTVDVFTKHTGYEADCRLPKITKVNGVNVFMSPAGSDANSGLSIDLPVKTLGKALLVSNVENILLLPGTYVSGTHFNAGQTIGVDVNLIALGDVTFENGASAAPIEIAADAYVYGIHFRHGNNTCKVTLGASGVVSFERCIFSESDAVLWSNGISVLGGHVYMLECEAYGNAYDGFNYHANGAVQNYCFEVNCKAYNNGYADLNVMDGQSNNGSSSHDSSIVRVNGDYYACHGGVIADLDTLSANYGCRSGVSTVTLAGYEDRMSNYWASGATCHMYLYGCKSYGSKYDTARVNGAVITSDTVYPSLYP